MSCRLIRERRINEKSKNISHSGPDLIKYFLNLLHAGFKLSCWLFQVMRQFNQLISSNKN